ncbi:MAG: GDP-fucose synthetase [Verrucomicrobia bacterium]|nr:MAG: GDP-fucose synthetase [Verrucomicrobiota bacterium]
MRKRQSIYVAGHRGMVGSAILRRLQLLSRAPILTRSREELDLCNNAQVRVFFERERPGRVIMAAAKVGGILANYEKPVEFLLENLRMQNNVISAAYETGVEKLLFLGSSCIYPKYAHQPISESTLLSGELEPTNEPYAIAKIAGVKLCQAYAREYKKNFISVMPTNLYGPNDNFDLHTSHVLPALIRKVHNAWERGEPSVTLWGTGKPRREFLHVDDLADACLFLLENYDSAEIINIGYGEDVTICELAQIICEVVGYQGKINFDHSKPDGTPRKLLDLSRLFSLGWRPRISLSEGIRSTYQWFLQNRKFGHVT